MFSRKKSRFSTNEFTILGVFVAVAVFGLGYGLLSLVLGTAEFRTDDLPFVQPVVAPTPEEYEADARDVLAPFLEQALLMRTEDLAGDTGAMGQLVEKTQDRLLRVRVPKEYRDLHLSMVLLLDQWKRALAGSAPARDVVLDRTGEIVVANPWLQTQ